MNFSNQMSRSMLAAALLMPLAAFWAEWHFGLPEGDGSTFRYIGQLVAEGGTMYADAWDNKGPVLLGAAALGRLLFPMHGNAGAVLLFALCAVAAIGLFARLSRSGLATLAFTCLYVGNYAGLGLVSQETLAMPFALLAMCVALDKRQRLVSGGILFGALVALVVFIKANLAGFALAGLFAVIERERQLRLVWHWTLSAAVGFCLIAGAIVGIFAWCGTLAEMIDCTFLFGMLEYGRRDLSLIGWWLHYLSGWRLSSGGWIVVHFAVMVALAACAWRSSPLWLKVWFVADAVSILAFRSFYGHYLIVCYPELCLMLSHSVKHERALRFFLLLTAALFVVYSIYGVALGIRRNSEIAAVAERVRGRTVAVWGDNLTAEVLVRSNARCPQRYFNSQMNYFFSGVRRRKEILRELEGVLSGGKAELFMMRTHSISDLARISPAIMSVLANCDREDIGRITLFWKKLCH